MGISLPFHFSPLENESTSCWIARLAHANCIDSHDLFHGPYTTADLSLNFDAFVGNDCYKLIDEARFSWGCCLPPAIVDFLHVIPASIDKRCNQYCPYCLNDAPVAFTKREWEFKWNTFCSTHNIPLTDKCIHCGNPCDIYNPLHYELTGLWQEPWGICSQCNNSLAAGTQAPPTHLPPKTFESIRSKAFKTNKQIELVFEGKANHLYISMALQIADVLISCPPKLIDELSIFLEMSDINISDYLYNYNEKIEKKMSSTWMPADSAIALAWHIIEEKQSVYDQFLKDAWLSRVYTFK